MTVYHLDGISPQIASDVWTAPNATIIGNVHLATEASIWFGAVLRGDNEPIRVGPRTNVQDLSMIHTDPGYPATIGADCTIGHRAILHGCTIEDEVLIGMGAVILNGAVIGSGSLVGANALIPEGKTIPENSLVVGSPGRVVRTLGDDDRIRLRQSASHYAENARRYRLGLQPVA